MSSVGHFKVKTHKKQKTVHKVLYTFSIKKLNAQLILEYVTQIPEVNILKNMKVFGLCSFLGINNINKEITLTSLFSLTKVLSSV